MSRAPIHIANCAEEIFVAKRILSVGNERRPLEETEFKLSFGDWNIFSAPADKALKLLRSRHFDLLLLMSTLAEEERTELIENARHYAPDLPILRLTADQKVELLTPRSGPVDFITNIMATLENRTD
jgi:DNA-binding response OmpR family regulator